MYPSRMFTGFALIGLLASCDGTQVTSTVSSPDPGGLALALPARVLEQVSKDSDSLQVLLCGPVDTLRSIARLADTLRFDGLRPGPWSIQAQLFSNDSGSRARHWEGSATAFVQGGAVARVSLLLRKATGSLVLDVSLDTNAYRDSGTFDTAHAIPTPYVTKNADSTAKKLDTIHNPLYIVPSNQDTGTFDTAHAIHIPYVTRIPDSLLDSSLELVTDLSSDTEFAQPSTRIQSAQVEAGSLRLVVTVFGTNTLPVAEAAPGQACLMDSNSTCEPWEVQIASRTAVPGQTVVAPNRSRSFVLWIDLSKSPEAVRRGVALSDLYGYRKVFQGLDPSLQRCAQQTTGLDACYDAAGFLTRRRRI